jgi:hypothetical protein
MGRTDLLLEATVENDLLHQEVEEIKIFSEQVASLTQQLLAFSQTGTQPEVLDLNLVANMNKLLRRIIGEDGVGHHFGIRAEHRESRPRAIRASYYEPGRKCA